MTSQTAFVGHPKVALDTPALLVDLDLMEDNIRRIAAVCRERGVAWRPHTKGIKVPGDRAQARWRPAPSASPAPSWAKRK